MKQNTSNSNRTPESRRAKLQVSQGAEAALYVPPRTVEAVRTLEDVKRSFSLPVTLGAPAEERHRLDMAFDAAGGYDAIYYSLQEHAGDLGQFPLTSFLGYGTLQQIAQNGMIRACVQTVADDMTREWIKITGGDNTTPEAVGQIEDACENRYRLKKVFHEAIEKIGYMGGAFIFIDTGAQGKDLALPLAVVNESSELVRGGELRFTVIDPVNVTPGEYNASDPLRPDYMRPSHWWVMGTMVHSSRLIAMFDNEPPTLLKPSYNFLGIPQAQILWDYVLHWNSCRVYTADLLRKVSLLVVHTDMDSVFASEEGLRNLDMRMMALARYRDNNSVFICDKNEEDVSNVTTTIAGCTDIVRQCLEMIAAINRTPAVKLLGISPSGFNATGESDIKNYYDHIRAKQELRSDDILRCLKCVQLVESGHIDPEIGFEFNALGTENAASMAMTASTRAQTLGALLDRQIVAPEEVRQAVKADPYMGMGFIDDEMPEDMGEPQDLGGEENEKEMQGMPVPSESRGSGEGTEPQGMPTASAAS